MNYLLQVKAFYDWLLVHPEATSDDIALWHALLSVNNQCGWKPQFSVAASTLMERSRLSHSALYRARDRRVQYGLIRIQARLGNQAALYEILPLDTCRHPASEDGALLSNAAEVAASVSPNGTQSGIQREQQSAVSPNGMQVGTQAGTQRGSIPKLNKTKQLNTLTLSFDEFWAAYDKKVGNRVKLENKWRQLSEEDRAAIMAYIPQYKQAQPDKQYRKNPETFLNNRTWEDELIPQTQKNTSYALPQKFTNHDPYAGIHVKHRSAARACDSLRADESLTRR